ncbi:RNA polymerase sigma factor [Nonomuraea typhae]|uniref:RNA polymerase sigma factor n=1 Tax=Nonomuraea typhae TaxID=2603600 RepID=UPI0012F7F0C0|nr:sigma-70 family RNA polymerase sigma factor [Nonomuraea typhae]
MTEDDDRYAALYHRHFSAVLRYAARRVGHDAAPDVAARTFTDAFRRLGQAPGEHRAERVWLLGIARGQVSNEWRGQRRRQALADRLAVWRNPIPPMEGEVVTRLAFHEALARLAGKDREALRLFYWEGLSVEEAATVAGCRTGAMATRLSRARARLREHLRTLGFQEGS